MRYWWEPQVLHDSNKSYPSRKEGAHCTKNRPQGQCRARRPGLRGPSPAQAKQGLWRQWLDLGGEERTRQSPQQVGLCPAPAASAGQCSKAGFCPGHFRGVLGTGQAQIGLQGLSPSCHAHAQSRLPQCLLHPPSPGTSNSLSAQEAAPGPGMLSQLRAGEGVVLWTWGQCRPTSLCMYCHTLDLSSRYPEH